MPQGGLHANLHLQNKFPKASLTQVRSDTHFLGGCFSNQRANHNHKGLTHKCWAPPPGEADASGQGNHTWRTSPLLHPPAALERLTHVLKGTDTFRHTQPASSSASLGPSLWPRSLGSNLSCLLYVLQAVLLLPQEGKQVGEE